MGVTNHILTRMILQVAGFSLRVATLGFVYSVILLPWWLRDIYEWSGLGMRDIFLARAMLELLESLKSYLVAHGSDRN